MSGNTLFTIWRRRQDASPALSKSRVRIRARDSKGFFVRRQPVGFRLPYMLREVRRGTRVFVYDAKLSARSYPGGYVGTI